MRGMEAERHDFARIIYGAAGHKLPPLRRQAQEKISASGLKAWAKAHNERIRAEEGLRRPTREPAKVPPKPKGTKP